MTGGNFLSGGNSLSGGNFLSGGQFLSGSLVRWIKFSIAGTAGFAVQIGTLAVLTQFAGLHYLVATVIAVELAILCNFVWHERWTWRDRLATRRRDRWTRLLRFNALTAVTSIAGSVALTAVFVELGALSPIAANVASVIALGVVNFAGANTLVFRAAAAVALTAAAATAGADTLEAILKPKTAQDFARYVAAVEARRASELQAHEPFLDIERQPPAQLARTMAALRKGEIVVTRGVTARGESGNEISIDGGTINHWRGTVFVPNVKMDDLLKALQEPQTDKHKQEDVISSRVEARDGDRMKIYLRLRRTKFVTVVYDTESDCEYRRLAPDRAVSQSISTKIVEIENYGTPRERALPEGNDRGYMWRLNSYWRYKTHGNGVLIEIESLTLSRDLPPIIGPLIRPIVTSTARESMTRTLASVRARFAD
jgi:putative flippase GtrA